MPRINPCLYTSSNDYYQIVPGSAAGRGERAFGVCVAASTIWGSKMLAGTRDILTKPDLRLTEAVQSRYNMYGEQHGYDEEATKHLFKFVNVKGKLKMQGKKSGVVLSYMSVEKGTFLVMNDEHAIGFHFTGSKHYFYDCDEDGAGGLFLYDNIDACRAKVLASDYPGDEEWEVWKLSR